MFLGSAGVSWCAAWTSSSICSAHLHDIFFSHIFSLIPREKIHLTGDWNIVSFLDPEPAGFFCFMAVTVFKPSRGIVFLSESG
ncbi:Unconventional myosin-VIIb, partial [Clarias magur]